MSKRRTRKQKEEAKHPFTVSWHPEAGFTSSEANVKRQIKKETNTPEPKVSKNKLSNFTAQYDNIASIKSDIVKSLTLASLILASEIVLYLIWK